MQRVKYLVNIVIVALLFAAVAIGKDGKLLGKKIGEKPAVQAVTTESKGSAVESLLDDGTLVINSESLAKDVMGFGGRTPVKLYIKDGVVLRVEALPNSETPSFFKSVEQSGLLESWDNMPIDEVVTAHFDAVSGATYSSLAIAENVQHAAAYAASSTVSNNRWLKLFNVKIAAGILVILTGVLFTFKRPKKKIFEVIQLALNVGVLGFWCGSFLSLAQITAWLANGFNLATSLLATLLLVVVVVVPLFGKKGSYCHAHCPMGSAQGLLNMLPTPKLKFSVKTNKFLNRLRYYILFALLLMMWVGVGFSIMDYEVFSAFLISSASTVVLVIAGIFLTLSLFITKPYCRFICPTGALLTVAQQDMDK